jgi:glucosamine--fructose-6-phosphate aminotransferase (isomerizing)
MSEQLKFAHYMLKEIYENPAAVRDTISPRVAPDGRIQFEGLRISEDELRNIKQIHILASGTSRHAGLAGKIMIQELAGVHVDVDYASEFQYSNLKTSSHELTIVITQSGETADTIAAMKAAASNGSKTIAIVNVADSAIAKNADSVIVTHAGPEIAIASTKAFTAQLAVLFLFAIYLGELRGTLTREETRHHVDGLMTLPATLEQTLNCNPVCEKLAEKFSMANDFLFLGRSVHHSAALDGALKLKEVSYIHAEAYPTGELKHGPYALIDAMMPIVCIATRDPNDPYSQARYKISLQHMRDIKARSGRIIAVAVEGCDEVLDITKDTIFVPGAPEMLLPMIEIVPLQLLAYHIALQRGLNVDRPRNLVKSVTEQ